jgi:threonyl-tRNA synthetase
LGLFADVDNGENTLPKKIRNGEIAQYNFILGMLCCTTLALLHIVSYLTYPSSTTVVGQEELDVRAVNVRNRDDVGTKAKGEMVSLDEIAEKLAALKASRSLENKLL